MTDTPTREQAIDALTSSLYGSIAPCPGCGDFEDRAGLRRLLDTVVAHLSAHPEQVAALGIGARWGQIEREVRSAIAAGVLASVANTTDARKRTIVSGVARQIDAQARLAQPQPEPDPSSEVRDSRILRSIAAEIDDWEFPDAPHLGRPYIEARMDLLERLLRYTRVLRDRADAVTVTDAEPDPLAHVKVGDPDPTTVVEVADCCEKPPWVGWACIRPLGHPGRHIGAAYGRVTDVWPAQPETGATA